MENNDPPTDGKPEEQAPTEAQPPVASEETTPTEARPPFAQAVYGAPPPPEAPAAPTDATAPAEDAPPLNPAARRKQAIVGLLAALVIGAAAAGIAYYGEKHGGSIATVNGVRIKRADYASLFEQTKRQYVARYNVDFQSAQGAQVEADMRNGIVKQLVEHQLILAEADRRNITVPEEAVTAKLTELKAGFKSEDEFNKQLTENGLDMPSFTGHMRDMLRVQKTVEAVTADVVIPDADIKTYYDQNTKLYDRPEETKASHILVKEEATLKVVQAKLAQGDDFSALAREYSTDEGSKGEGGSLGYFSKGKMVKPFEDAAFKGAIGKVSAPVKTQFGFHLIKVEDRRAARHQTFAEVKDEIKENLTANQRRNAFSTWLNGQRAAAKVTYKAGFEPTASTEPDDDNGHGHGPGDGHGH